MRILGKGFTYGNLNKIIVYIDNFGECKKAIQGNYKPWIVVALSRDCELVRNHFLNQFHTIETNKGRYRVL